MTSEEIIGEFTHQAETFGASTVARSPPTLDELLRLAAPRSSQRWLEVACGPGIISRRLAGEVAEVHGVDVTPAMIEVARREAAPAGASNVLFGSRAGVRGDGPGRAPRGCDRRGRPSRRRGARPPGRRSSSGCAIPRTGPAWGLVGCAAWVGPPG